MLLGGESPRLGISVSLSCDAALATTTDRSSGCLLSLSMTVLVRTMSGVLEAVTNFPVKEKQAS